MGGQLDQGTLAVYMIYTVLRCSALQGIFQMLLTLQDRNFSPLAAPVGSGFY